MKTPITVRIEPELLAAVRQHARQENRTLTNFIETVLRKKVGVPEPLPRSVAAVGRTKLKQDASDVR